MHYLLNLNYLNYYLNFAYDLEFMADFTDLILFYSKNNSVSTLEDLMKSACIIYEISKIMKNYFKKYS